MQYAYVNIKSGNILLFLTKSQNKIRVLFIIFPKTQLINKVMFQNLLDSDPPNNNFQI